MATPATREDLKFLATLCIVAAHDLKYIETTDFGNWTIMFDDKGDLEKQHFLGATVSQDYVNYISLNPKLTEDNILAVIAHEIIHQIQFMRGDAQYSDGISGITWKGQQVELLPGNHPDYRNQPWEEEAYRLAPNILKSIKDVGINSIMKVYMTYDTSEWSLAMLEKFRAR